MRFSTDDGLFGFVVTRLSASGMYRFQLVIDGELVGDTEPCFIESAMASLGKISELDDSRLSRISVDAGSVLAVLDSDAALHDAALLQVAESLDGWTVRGYVYAGNAVILAARLSPDRRAAGNEITVSIVPAAEYGTVFAAAHEYWAKTRHGEI